MIEAGHPVPDAAGLDGGQARAQACRRADADDLVLVLLSGGASANWIAPVDGAHARRQAGDDAGAAALAAPTSARSIRCASISRASRAGGSPSARSRRKVVTLAISDVPGDDPAVIGSGPTVPDPSTLDDARAIVARYRLALPDAVRRALDDPANETPKPGDEVFAATEFGSVARPADALAAAAARARRPATNASCWATACRARRATVAAEHARLALSVRSRRAAAPSSSPAASSP